MGLHISPRIYHGTAERLLHTYPTLCPAAKKIIEREDLSQIQRSMVELGLGFGTCLVVPGAQWLCGQILGGAMLGHMILAENQRQDLQVDLNNSGVIEMVHMSELLKAEPRVQDIAIGVAFFAGGGVMAVKELGVQN